MNEYTRFGHGLMKTGDMTESRERGEKKREERRNESRERREKKNERGEDGSKLKKVHIQVQEDIERCLNMPFLL